MKKRFIVLLVISLSVLVYCYASLATFPKFLQAVEYQPNLEELDQSLDFARDLLVQNESITSESQSVSVDLHAVNSKFYKMYHMHLLSGRLPYPKEMDDVIVLDKNLEYKLFASESAIDNYVKIAQKKFRVIGVVEELPNAKFKTNAFVTINSFITNKIKPELLISSIYLTDTVSAQFESKYKDNVWNLPKEVERSIIGGKLALFIFLTLVLSLVLKFVIHHIKIAHSNIKSSLERLYPRQMKLKLLKFVLLSSFAIAIVIAGYCANLVFLVSSIIKFPEWLPEILVDFKKIYESYVSNMIYAARPLVLKTPQITSIEHFSRLISLFLPIAIICAISPLFNRKEKQYD